MKILHIVPSFHPAHVYGGPIESVYALCRALVRQQCDVRVLSTDADGLDRVLEVATDRELEQPGGVKVRYCHRLARHSISIDLLRRLPEALRWADLVHLTAVYSFPTLPTLLACRLLGKPLVWSPRGALQRWPGSRKLGRKKLFAAASSALAPRQFTLHVTSQQESDESQIIFPGAQLAMIANGVDIPQELSTRPDSGALRLVFLGRLDSKKGIENLLDACALARRQNSIAFTLTIAGAGEASYERWLHQRIETLGLNGPVQMIGAVHGDAKQQLLASASLVIVPSHTENFAMVVAEALAHGAPVIASRGTPWQRVEEIGCGLWVANDAASLADAIARMNSMPLKEMGQRGRAWMEREFSWDGRAEEMIRVYRSMTAASAKDAVPLTAAT